MESQPLKLPMLASGGVARRLGFAPENGASGGIQLEEMIPHGIRYSLHVTLVAHGRAI